MTRPFARGMFSSLAVRNYRLFFAGQAASASGTWMQQIAIAWLVLRLTDSAVLLGLTTALQMLPYLLFGAWGGLIVDRLDKRRLLICTQIVQVIPALLLWLLTETGAIRIWMVFAIVAFRGSVNTLDNPARQSFVIEMVGRDRVVNAVSLNASLTQAARLFGPAMAAGVIAGLGLAPCFLLNAFSFGFMICALLLMRPSELYPAPIAVRRRGQLREGLAIVASSPELRLPLLEMAVVGLLSFNFTVVLPLLARYTFHGTATAYAAMTSVMAVGALAGALVSGSRTSVSSRTVCRAAVAFGVAMGLAAIAPTFGLVLLALLAVGATSVTFSASTQSALQLNVEPEMRGRVMALYQIVYQGSTPLGAVAIGALASAEGPRSGLVVGAVAAVLAGLWGLALLAHETGRRMRVPALGSRSVVVTSKEGES